MFRPVYAHASWAALLLFAAEIQPAPAVEKIQVLGLFQDKAVILVDGKRRLLRKGEKSPEGITLVSADSDGTVLEIHGKQEHYSLGTHIATTYAAPAKGPSVRIWPTADGMYTVSGSINGFPVNFLVDTGATLIAMNGVQARRLGIDYRVVGEAGASSTASGIVKSYYVTLSRVKVGDIQFDDVPAAVLDGNFPREVLLGNSFLNRLDMQRDGTVLELRKKQ